MRQSDVGDDEVQIDPVFYSNGSSYHDRYIISSMTSRPEVNVDHAKKIRVAILHKFEGHPAFFQEESRSYNY